MVVADNHAVVHQGIANLIAADDRIAVAREVSDGPVAIDVVEQKRPDVVLMDVKMPEMNGIEATREIRSRWPETRVIRISVQADRATDGQCSKPAPKRFPKSGDTEQIIGTILQVTGGSSPEDE